MTTAHRVIANAYKDSVALLAISSKLLSLHAISGASVVMATPTNLENLVDAGLADGLTASPSDLVVAVAGEDAAACEAALPGGRRAARRASRRRRRNRRRAATEQHPGRRYARSVADTAAFSEAWLIHAATQAQGDHRARHEPAGRDLQGRAGRRAAFEIKTAAGERDLLVMGPDCGTAIVNGVPLGFANVVRRGDIGLVAASGTGLQEVTCRIHNLGGGVSQALGTGGRDLKEEIGGITMLQGLAALAADAQTRVIVLISKPPAPAIARQIEDAAGAAGKPVVVHFLGAAPERVRRRRPVRRRSRCGMPPTWPWHSPAATRRRWRAGATRCRR